MQNTLQHHRLNGTDANRAGTNLLRREPTQSNRLSTRGHHLPQALCIIDTEQHCIKVNRAFHDLTGLSKEDINNGRLPFFTRPHQNECVTEQLMGCALEYGSWSERLLGKRPDGSLFTTYLTLYNIREGSDQPTHLVISFSDHTALQ